MKTAIKFAHKQPQLANVVSNEKGKCIEFPGSDTLTQFSNVHIL